MSINFQTTGLTRLNVAKNPHYTLSVLYGKILRTIRKMPEDASYRKYTEEIVSNRAKIVQEVITVYNVVIVILNINIFFACRLKQLKTSRRKLTVGKLRN